MVDTVATAETSLTSSSSSMMCDKSMVRDLHPFAILLLHSNCGMGTGHDRSRRVTGASVLTMALAFLVLLLAGCWTRGGDTKVVAASVMPHGEN